jgi:hypothetical protein
MAKRRKAGTIRIPKADDSGGGRVRVPEGDYRVKVIKIKEDESKSGNEMLVVDYKGLDGKLKGKKLRDYMTLTPKSAWKIREMIAACGVKVPDSMFDLPYKKLVGKELAVTVEDDEYENKISSKIRDYIDLETYAEAEEDEDEEDDEDLDDDELEDEDDEDEDEDDEEDDEDEDDLDDMSRSELKAYIKENDLEVKVKKSMDEDDIRAAIRDADDEDDDDDLDEIDLDEL